MARQGGYVLDITKKRRRNRFFFLVTAAILVGSIISVISLLLIFRTPIFRVRDIKIEGNSRISEDEVRTFLRAKVPSEGFVGHFFGARMIFVWPGGFSREELALLSEVREINIEKNYLRRSILVTVGESERKGIWCFRMVEEGKCFWFDEEGRLLRQVPQTFGNLIPVVQDLARQEIGVKEPVLPARLFSNFLSVLQRVRSAPVNVSEIRLEELQREELRVTTDGPDMLFSLRFPAPDLTAALEALDGKTDVSGLQYLDFRVEKRVYYK